MQLGDICGELKQVLVQLECECQSMSTRVRGFEGFAASYITGELRRKLKIVADFVTARAESLYKQAELVYKHEGRGHVFVLLRKGYGISLSWAPRDTVASARNQIEAAGYTVSSVEEVTGTITELMDELDSGNWVKAIEWLREYGRLLG